MEVATGKIKAIANLGHPPGDSVYWEDLNYAIQATEPGSTFKLATLMSLLEDKEVKLTDHVNLEGGVWRVAGRTVYDSEKHDKAEDDATVKKAFEVSSNVGMAKLVWTHYGDNPTRFVDDLKRLKLNQPTGVDLVGETQAIIKTPKSKTWSATTLPWMAFGYEVLISPLQTLSLYNAVANNGKLMRPYLVSAVQESGISVRENEPHIVLDKVCSERTLRQVKECLEGVCIEGTAKSVFKNSFYKVAGKTGTALVANGKSGYKEHIYQSSFAGYFPADHPKYSCIVVIRNKPFAKKFLGAIVAAPVFKELADKLMSSDAEQYRNSSLISGESVWKKDSAQYYYAGSAKDIRQVMQALGMSYQDSTSKTTQWGRLYASNYQPVLNKETLSGGSMPDVKGMGLKDALYLLENMHVQVLASGRGKVRSQSIIPGTMLKKNETITIALN
jgi:cell division protein FtsI (penicillin-binding protein 3)